MTYNVDYFIKKFEAIPEDQWTTGERHGSNGTHCAHGWCDLNELSMPYLNTYSNEEKSLVKVFTPIMKGTGCAKINNGFHPNYQQPTPKQRILAALYDIKKMQQPEKVKTVYVSVPQTITEQTKELVLN